MASESTGFDPQHHMVHCECGQNSKNIYMSNMFIYLSLEDEGPWLSMERLSVGRMAVGMMDGLTRQES